MGTNLLRNPSFELGWDDVVLEGREVQAPHGWDLTVLPVGVWLSSEGAFDDIDHPPVMERVATIPEIVHRLDYQLPPEEQVGGPRALILDGKAVYKIFGNGPFSACLSQTVTALRPGALVELVVPVRVHYQPWPGGDGSPGACACKVFNEMSTSAWMTYGHDLEDREWSTVRIMSRVPQHGSITVGAIFESRSEAGIDWFTDLWRLEYVGEPEPEPDPVDYVVVVNLLPQDTTQDELDLVLEETFRRRESILYSADDAARLVAPGPPGSLVRVYDPQRWDDDIVQWLKDRGVAEVLTARFAGGEVPPVGGEPEPLHDPGILIGLHCQKPKTGWLDYYRALLPGVFKGFELGMCVEAKAASPTTLVVYRFHVDNDGYWIHQPDPRASARAFLDLYSRSILAHARATGMTEAEVLRYVDVIESVNEVIGTHDPDLEPGVAFDCAFAEAVEERYGNELKAGILTIPVGNPHQDEFHKLLPAARVSSERGHYLAYHPYWGANREQTFLVPRWSDFAGRWCEWDKVFNAHGLYPLYYGGEAGVCFSTDGWKLNPNLGWKGCGPFSRYIEDLQLFDRLAAAWNAQHGNRFRGATIFCYGSDGWDGFDWEPGDLWELTAAFL